MRPLYLATLLLSFISLAAVIQAKRNSRILQSSGDTTLPTSSVDIGGLFTLYFDFEPTSEITMAIRFKIPGQYFSIGFGSRMSGTDMWVFELVNSAIIASDHVGVGHQTPPLDTNRGGTDDLQVLGYEIGSSYSLVKVKRALNTWDPHDAVIHQGFTDIIYATAESPTMALHLRSERGHVSIPLIQGVHTSVPEDLSAEKTDDIHSIVNLIAWGALVDIGIIIVRLFRGTNFKIGKYTVSIQIIHGVLMTSVVVMSAAVTILLLLANGEDGGVRISGKADSDFHLINGLIILIFIAMTMFLGVLNTRVLKTYDKPIISKYTVKSLHRITGIILYLTAKANLISGALIYGDGSWTLGICVSTGVLFALHIIVQIFCTYKSYTSNKVFTSPHGSSQYKTNSDLLEAINQGTPKYELMEKFPKLKWVTLGNRVYDLTDWIHPGGNFIIQACIGREIGRYFFGNYALEETKVQPHTHSSLTVSQMQKYCIGEITNLEGLLVKKGTDIETVSLATHKWKIVSKTSVTPTVSEIGFQCPDFEIKNFGKSLSWLGRHYKVSHDSNSSSARLYTTSFSLSKTNFNLRQNIYQYFEDVMNGNKSAVFTYDKNYHASQDVLPLYIKDYAGSSKVFSHLIHTTQMDGQSNQFRIEGPLGQGLELTPSATGTHCIVCAGTGVLPFIDFLNLFLWKTMYDLIKKTAGVEKAESINVLKIPFDMMFNQMTINFVGAFSSPKEVLGLDIIAKLAELSQKYNLNNFNGMMKGYSDAYIGEVKENFSTEVLKKFIMTNKEKFYVVGPPKMNEEVPRILEELGVNKDKIMLV